jgi:hypothetical protein
VLCSRLRDWTQGIFCANFGARVWDSSTCQNVWCGECYSSSETTLFHTASDDAIPTAHDDEDRLTSGWRKRKGESNRFKTARNGDDLLVSFECDVCIFRKLYHRESDPLCTKDEFALSCIRRINLDAFWSRARATVESNTAKVREGLRLSTALGLSGPYLSPGPLPMDDHCGYEVAMQMVSSSLGAGRYSNNHKQWDTIRKLRSSYSNQVRASRSANAHTLSLADDKGTSYQRMSVDPCGSMWFQRFLLGCKKRMGQDWRPNQAIGVDLMRELLTNCERQAMGSEDLSSKHKWVLAGGYFCICFVLSLRSPEGLMLDLEGLIHFFGKEEENVIVPLLGRFKGEHHAKQHLLLSKGITGSGIRVRLWVERILAVHRSLNRVNGPAFVNSEGEQSSTSDMNDVFIESLIRIYDEKPDLFGFNIESSADLQEKFNVFRSFRRGSESRAVAMKISEADRYVVNRWKRKESAGSGRVGHSIDQHYVDVALVNESFLRYTAAM